MLDLSIIIVSHNVGRLLAECLRSISNGHLAIAGVTSKASRLRAEVLVVDSRSSDDTQQMVREEFPWAKLIDLDENVGFSRGNNLGMRASSGRLIMLLNPDTVIIDDALPRLCDFLDTHPDCAVVGPQLLNGDSSVQSSRRRFPTLMTAFFESTCLQPLAPQGLLKRYYLLDRGDGETIEVDWVTGAAMLARREVVEQVGGLDEGYFMYSEELDWQRRVKQAGWKIVYYPSAQVIHYGGKSSEQAVSQTQIAFQTSKVRYFHKHHGPVAGWIVRTFLLATYAAQIVVEAMKSLVGHKRAMRVARVKTYLAALRSGFKGHA